MCFVVFSFGSNIGDCKANIKKCYSLIEKRLNCKLTTSRFYKTKPWGNTNQPDFINSAAFAHISNYQPIKILECVLNIEKDIGRERNEKWGPRIIDIDLLFIDDKIINKETLKIPHPFIQDRIFVLEPLAEILPKYIHPILKKDINTLLQELNNRKLNY